jgi:DNA invertase Pin-like site-specific DNA recombinase
MVQQATRFVVYLRVSTVRQGQSGLGLEAQREAVQRYVAERSGKIAPPEFVEVETGKRDDRPELQSALAKCKRTGATLVVAKLDRLSRDLAFIATLMKSGVEFLAVDNPHATKLTIHILAAVAENEREMISARTKAALAAAKARGTVLGGRRKGSADIRKYQAAGAKAASHASRQRATQAAEERRETIEALQRENLSLNAIAARLNADSVRTSRGGNWTATAVKRTLERLN